MNHPAQIAIASTILGMGIGSSVHAADPPVIFVGETLDEAPSESGLDFVNPLLPDDPRNFLYPFGYACGGVNIGDLDGDGRPDVFCVGGPVANGLYLQVGEPGEMRFERLPDGMVDGGDAWGTGASLVDIDGDGDLDIHVCNYDSPNQLFINESTPGTPPSPRRPPSMVSISATPRSSQLRRRRQRRGSRRLHRLQPVRAAERPSDRGPRAIRSRDRERRHVPAVRAVLPGLADARRNFEADSYSRDDFLMINTGPGPDGRPRFVDATEASGIDGAGHALAVTWIDVDRDGLVDLHVANDFEDPDRFYRNLGPGEDGMVRFVDVIADVLPYTTWSSMGTDVADLDGDGLLDLMVADMSATTHFKAKVNMGEMGGRQRRILETAWPRQAMRNMVYLDTGLGNYREAAFLAGLSSSDWTWAVKLGDFDLDGRPDVLLTNGMSRNYTDSDRPFSTTAVRRTQWDHFRDDPPLLEWNLAMQNDGDLRFSDVGGEWGLDKYGMSYAAAYGDIDLDGDLDLVVMNLNELVSLNGNGPRATGSRSACAAATGTPAGPAPPSRSRRSRTAPWCDRRARGGVGRRPTTRISTSASGTTRRSSRSS